MSAPPLYLAGDALQAALDQFEGPVALARRGLIMPASPGVYIVASGDCVSHIGTSGSLRGRVGQLAGLGTHRGSAEVLCAAYCTKLAPQVWWQSLDRGEIALLERQLKAASGEPPTPRERFSSCVNGLQLRDDLVAAAGVDSWEAGFVEAVFAIGEKLRLLFQPRFHRVWQEIGIPPGPWAELVDPVHAQ
jgi:hypothetical protein